MINLSLFVMYHVSIITFSYPEGFAQPATALGQPTSLWKKLSFVGRAPDSRTLVGTFVLIFFVSIANKLPKTVPESVQNQGIMLVEVTSELHGEPVVPEMNPGYREDVSLDFFAISRAVYRFLVDFGYVLCFFVF